MMGGVGFGGGWGFWGAARDAGTDEAAVSDVEDTEPREMHTGQLGGSVGGGLEPGITQKQTLRRIEGGHIRERRNGG